MSPAVGSNPSSFTVHAPKDKFSFCENGGSSGVPWLPLFLRCKHNCFLATLNVGLLVALLVPPYGGGAPAAQLLWAWPLGLSDTPVLSK